jgi:hypothetical protein
MGRRNILECDVQTNGYRIKMDTTADRTRADGVLIEPIEHIGISNNVDVIFVKM